MPGVLRHLRRLTRSFVHEGQRIAYLHVYTRPLAPGREPPLEFITAQESGFEGIACIDDAARAALLALHRHALLAAQPQEQERAAVALGLAHDWLRFVTYMQEPDGRFVNFIADAAGAKNRQGRTSYAGGPWWTARALRALATAWRATGEERYGRHFLRGRLTPTSDLKVTALQALALMGLYQFRPEPRLRQRICALCDAIVATGPGYFRDRRGRDEVALWGYHQVQAVAQATRLFARLDYVRACQETARNLSAPVVAGGFYHVVQGVPAPAGRAVRLLRLHAGAGPGGTLPRERPVRRPRPGPGVCGLAHRPQRGAHGAVRPPGGVLLRRPCRWPALTQLRRGVGHRGRVRRAGTAPLAGGAPARPAGHAALVAGQD